MAPNSLSMSSESMASLQDVFRQHFAQYASGRKLHSREVRAANSIMTCYTPEAGSHVLSCPDGHFHRRQDHACRHRSCPKCADGPRQKWIAAELERLLPCPHFHVIFTLPHELLPLWEFNRAAFAAVLFDSVRLSLLELLADPRHLGATPGLLLNLHTWGRNLSQHPHIHALVSAGGLSPAGAWIESRKHYLLPLRVLQAMYQGKLLGILTQQLDTKTWALPARLGAAHWKSVIAALYKKHWNIQINPPYEHGRGVALYLARYAKGGPLPKTRALHSTAEQVSFSYTDHRDHKSKRLRLKPQQFIARILWHAAPKHTHTVRHAGLYARAAHAARASAVVAQAAAQICANQTYTANPASMHSLLQKSPNPAKVVTCPTCNALLRRPSFQAHWRDSQISLSIYRRRSKPLGQRVCARPNSAFKLTKFGVAEGPTGCGAHPQPVGPSATPNCAA